MTTTRKDNTIKVKLYAKAGTQECWIADTNARTIIVHREPENEKYKSVVTYTTKQKILCRAKHNPFKRVDELIAPASDKAVQNTKQ